MSACLAITPRRPEHLDFTDTYFISQVVFFAREDMPYMRNISDLQARAVDVRLVLPREAVRGEADPDILHRMLLNLIGNAVKASSRGASVEVLTIDGGSR